MSLPKHKQMFLHMTLKLSAAHEQRQRQKRTIVPQRFEPSLIWKQLFTAPAQMALE